MGISVGRASSWMKHARDRGLKGLAMQLSLHPTRRFRITGLIVIDMQETFPAALSIPLRQTVKREIMLAKRRNAPILFVEYQNCKPTLPDLVSTVKGYHNCYTLTKPEDDGSLPILGFLAEFPHFIPTWRVCGVHLDACVLDTVRGLNSSLPTTTLEIVKEGVEPAKWDKKILLSKLQRQGIRIK